MGGDVCLRRFNFRQDVEDMFEIMNDPNDQMLFIRKMPFNTLPDFDMWMQNNFKGFYHEFNVITDNQSSYDFLGFVYSYEYSPVDLHCKVCLVLKKEYRNMGLGGKILINFLNYLFTDYPLRKVFLTIYDYNKQSLDSNLQAGFIEEGVMKEYRYHNGKFHDLHILSMTREEFYKRFDKFLNRK